MEQSALARKMGIKPGSTIRLIGSPDGFAEDIAPLPDGARLTDSGPALVVALFCRSKGDLDSGLNPALTQMMDGGDLWIAYPKGKSQEAKDLTRDIGWEALDGSGLEGVNLISFGDSWSGFKFRRTGKPQLTDAEQLEQLFAGSRAAIRPLYDAVVVGSRSLGPDVKYAVRKTYVALVRGKQFAVLSPQSGRMDVGLKLKGMPANDRLEESRGFGSGSITHRVSLRSLDDIDAEFLGWLRTAHEGTAGKQPVNE